MRIGLICVLFMMMMIGGCKTDKSPISSMEDLDPNGEEELLQVLKNSEEQGVVKVMTRNVYIGTNVTAPLNAPSFEFIPFLVWEGYQNVIMSNFYQRAEGLVTEIEKTLPHLIGLQEMSKFYIQSPGDFLDGNPVQATEIVLDFFEILENALAARGLEYEYTFVATIKNADLELPMAYFEEGSLFIDDIRIQDHDAILARSDVVTSNEVAVRYDSMLVIDDSLGIFIPRGYVACNAQIGQTSVIFTNTHLESMGSTLREVEVKQLLDAYKNESLPVIMVGDYNSHATTGTTYNYVISEGYTDTWLMNPLKYNLNGYTYGHDLRDETSDLSRRIDFIFTGPQGNPTIGEGFVLGDERRDFEDGLWPSDHAGVVTKLTYTVPAEGVSN